MIAGAWRPFTTLAFRPLFVTALVAVFTHILLDVIAGAAVRAGWPFLPGRTAAGLVAMADPWLAIPFALALIVVLLTRWRVEQVAPATVLVVCTILAMKLLSRQMAVAEYHVGSDRTALSREVHAQWNSLTRWWIYEKTIDRARLWDVDGWRRESALVLDRELAGPERMIGAEADLVTVENFLLAHHLPVRVSIRTPTLTTVLWSDLRFCFVPDPRSGPQPGSRLRPTSDTIACGVWFGGELDPGGRIVRQFVTIGDFVQER